VVPAAHDGERLDRALAAPASGVTRGEARRLIAAGVVFVGGRRCGICSRAVRAGETITWQTPARQPDGGGGQAPGAPTLRVVVERPGFWIFDKPAGMAVEPTRAGKLGTLTDVVRARLGEPALITHRLDAATSGLLVVARQPAVQAELNGLLAAHAIGRRYLAVVSVDMAVAGVGVGVGAGASALAERLWSAGALTIDRPLDGKRAVTHLRLVGRSASAASLVVDLETGRTHQIRRHLVELGCPIIGESPSGQRTGGRLMLHAYRLILPGRFSGGAIDVTAPLPEALRATLRTLGLPPPEDLPEPAAVLEEPVLDEP
jgi:23S rRNA pseudouridine1911/1915/1917 synthase